MANGLSTFASIGQAGGEGLRRGIPKGFEEATADKRRRALLKEEREARRADVELEREAKRADQERQRVFKREENTRKLLLKGAIEGTLDQAKLPPDVGASLFPQPQAAAAPPQAPIPSNVAGGPQLPDTQLLAQAPQPGVQDTTGLGSADIQALQLAQAPPAVPQVPQAPAIQPPNLLQAISQARTPGRVSAQDLRQLQAQKIERGLSLTPFQSARTKFQAKSFQKDIDKLPEIQKNIDQVDKTIDRIIDFEESSIAGTGPVAQFGLSAPLVNPEAELLDREFKKLQLEKMRALFAGMAKAIDSDSERRFFQQSQASLGNRPETNLSLLLGAKSIDLKNKAEIQAKDEFVRQNKSLEGYKSPIIDEMTTLIDESGEMVLINKEDVNQSKLQGFLDVDEFVKVLLGESRASITRSRLKKSGLTDAEIDQELGR